MAEVSIWDSGLSAGTLPPICIKSGEPADGNFAFDFVTIESPIWTLVSLFLVRARFLPTRIGPVWAKLPFTRRWLWTIAIVYGLQFFGRAVAFVCLLLLLFLPQAPKPALSIVVLAGALTSVVTGGIFSVLRPRCDVHRAPAGQLWIHLKDVHPNFVAGLAARSRLGLTPDGLWFWGGSGWASTTSPDGIWKWSGLQWEPASHPATMRPIPTWLLVLGGVSFVVLLGALAWWRFHS